MNSAFWTEEELSIVNNQYFTDEVVAEKTGRSIESVKMKRWHLKKGDGNVRGPKVKSDGLGYRIQKLRLDKNLTREELGLAIGYGTEKSARNNVGQIENEVRKPTEEKLRAMAKIFGVTPAYLLTGKEEEPKKEVKPVSELPDPQPLKTAMANHEGYNDPTAAKAVAIVMNSKGFGDKVLPKHNPKPGQIYDVLNATQPIVIISVCGENVLATNLRDKPNRNIGLVKVLVGNDFMYVDPTKLFTRRIVDLISMTGSIASAQLLTIRDLYSKNFGFGEIKAKEPEKADQISLRFVDSMNYYNDKNGTSVKAPEGVISLQMAIDISKEMNVTIDDLVKDHTEDRVLDEICTLEERIKELKDKIGLN